MEVRFYERIQPECRAIRGEVFIAEQGFSYEFDETDAIAEHALVWEDGEPLATARLFLRDGEATIGRFAVRKCCRGKGVGTFLMRAMLERARQKEVAVAVVDAQCRARAFYELCGFVADERVKHCEDGVPHVRMTKAL